MNPSLPEYSQKEFILKFFADGRARSLARSFVVVVVRSYRVSSWAHYARYKYEYVRLTNWIWSRIYLIWRDRSNIDLCETRSNISVLASVGSYYFRSSRNRGLKLWNQNPNIRLINDYNNIPWFSRFNYFKISIIFYFIKADSIIDIIIISASWLALTRSR